MGCLVSDVQLALQIITAEDAGKVMAQEGDRLPLTQCCKNPPFDVLSFAP